VSESGDIVGIEAESVATANAPDTRGLRLLRDKLGPRFKAGVIYSGEHTLPSGDRIWQYRFPDCGGDVVVQSHRAWRSTVRMESDIMSYTVHRADCRLPVFLGAEPELKAPSFEHALRSGYTASGPSARGSMYLSPTPTTQMIDLGSLPFDGSMACLPTVCL
jgi:hypothetical protein